MIEPWEHLGSVASVLTGMGRACVMRGDCMGLGALVPDESIDALVTDPPSGIAFMGKSWDTDKGGRDAWIAWLAERMRLAYRLLKPGAHALVWALPRTSHWTATAVEDAGFEIRDVVMHLFGSGFPKSLNISKAIDDALGTEREIVGVRDAAVGFDPNGQGGGGWSAGRIVDSKPGSDQAAQWEGWGTALKPAAEHWILARKPLASTVARNVMEHGTGGLNIDGCRIGGAWTGAPSGRARHGGGEGTAMTWDLPDVRPPSPEGRWPAHVTLSHTPECERVGERIRPLLENAGGADPSGEGFGSRAIGTEPVTHDVYVCAHGCPVAMLDEQSGILEGGGSPASVDASASIVRRPEWNGWSGRARAASWHDRRGGASRFFYTAKPSRSEKETGLRHLPKRTAGEATDREDGSDGLNNPRAGAGRTGGARNFHPTVKPVELMRWLCKLITPPGGVVLDMFAGTGTTLVAALDEDFRAIGCELDADGEYLPLLLGRVTEALGRHKQMDLFAGAAP